MQLPSAMLKLHFHVGLYKYLVSDASKVLAEDPILFIICVNGLADELIVDSLL